MTNKEWVQSLNADELANFIAETDFCETFCECTGYECQVDSWKCRDKIRNWLNKEREGTYDC